MASITHRIAPLHSRRSVDALTPLTPYIRESGAGAEVICLHANASNSGQWRDLMALLAPKYHVQAADSYGAGRSPPWPSTQPLTLRDEVAFLEPVFARATPPFVLIGHSYGGAVALMAAMTAPQRVRALVLYEPTLFSLLDAEKPPPNDADLIRQTVVDSTTALDAGDPMQAAGCFIDYWMGAGTWAAMPEARKGPIAASVVNVRDWAHALMDEPTPLGAFAQLDLPVLYMTGKTSPASSLGVARLLIKTLPRVEGMDFAGLGHMGPVTHPDVVNAAIARFLERLA